MNAPVRGGGVLSLKGSIPARSAWPSIVIAGVLCSWLEPAPCAAQAPGAGAAGVASPSAALPGSASLAASQPPATFEPPAGAQPVTPGATPPPVMPRNIGPGGVVPMPGANAGMPGASGENIMQSRVLPIPMPPEAVPEQLESGPLPVTAVVPLPALAHDHFGDGAGTVGSFLIWQGQLPNNLSPYADGDGQVGGPIGPIGHLNTVSPPSHSVLVHGPLGYGPPGAHPGFYGFGLSFHPGYGYGGNGLGVGIDGGYPCYGGPGYPIKYGYPHFAYPYYEGIGQLYYDPPVVLSDLINAGNFGPYTGASIYAYTHPTYTAEAAATGTITPGTYSLPDTSATNAAPEATFSPRSAEVPNVSPPGASRVLGQERYLGMDIGPVDAEGQRGMRIVNILPGSTAERAGLQVGDIIISSNGYVTEALGHLNWIITNAAPERILRLTVRKASDGRVQTVTLTMP